jgi:hypothetical protein
MSSLACLRKDSGSYTHCKFAGHLKSNLEVVDCHDSESQQHPRCQNKKYVFNFRPYMSSRRLRPCKIIYCVETPNSSANNCSLSKSSFDPKRNRRRVVCRCQRNFLRASSPSHPSSFSSCSVKNPVVMPNGTCVCLVCSSTNFTSLCNHSAARLKIV